jgi:hypothetical protein
VTPTEARACPCGCFVSFHNWGTPGFPRIITFAESVSNRCDRCGHPPEGAPPAEEAR